MTQCATSIYNQLRKRQVDLNIDEVSLPRRQKEIIRDLNTKIRQMLHVNLQNVPHIHNEILPDPTYPTNINASLPWQFKIHAQKQDGEDPSCALTPTMVLVGNIWILIPNL